MKILLLCHGNNHAVDGVDSIGFPISIKLLKSCTTLDQNKESDPDILENFTLPTKIKTNTFDVIGGIYCQYPVFIDDNGKLVKNYFNNVIKVLKPNGLLFMNGLPLSGIARFVQFLLKNKLYIHDDNKKCGIINLYLNHWKKPNY